jgi:shikimate kinase
VADDAATRHIVFVGAMGTGKTTIGRRVAAALGRAFVDNDELLERTTGSTAAELAARDGAAALHRVEETTLLDALDAQPPAVIAAAASTIEEPKVRSALRHRAWVAWLRAAAPTLLARMPESVARPFADADPARLVTERAQRRDGRYAEAADAEFWTDRARSDQVVSDVLAALRRAGIDT